MKTPASKLKVDQRIMLRFDGLKEESFRITEIAPDPIRKNWVRIELDGACACSIPATQIVTTRFKLTMGGKPI